MSEKSAKKGPNRKTDSYKKHISFPMDFTSYFSIYSIIVSCVLVLGCIFK